MGQLVKQHVSRTAIFVATFFFLLLTGEMFGDFWQYFWRFFGELPECLYCSYTTTCEDDLCTGERTRASCTRFQSCQRAHAHAYTFQSCQIVLYTTYTLCFLSPPRPRQVLENLALEYGDDGDDVDLYYGHDNVVISGTHTHSGPAGFLQYLLFQVSVGWGGGGGVDQERGGCTHALFFFSVASRESWQLCLVLPLRKSCEIFQGFFSPFSP